MLEQILQALAPVMSTAADHLVELILVSIAAMIKKYVGVQIDEKHMRALHSAALTGVKVAIETGLTGDRVRDAALKYVRTSVPDAVKRLVGGKDTLLGQIVESKMSDALASKVSIQAPLVGAGEQVQARCRPDLIAKSRGPYARKL